MLNDRRARVSLRLEGEGFTGHEEDDKLRLVDVKGRTDGTLKKWATRAFVNL